MTKRSISGALAGVTFGAVALCAAGPAGAQVVLAPTIVAGAPIVPVLAAMEAPGCPLYGYGQWTFVNGGWVWCPPSSVAYAAPVGQAALSGYYGFGLAMPPPTIAVAPPVVSYAPAYGSAPAYGGLPVAYGSPYSYYSSPYAYAPTYGYGVQVGYVPPVVPAGYGYVAPVASLTGSPALDLAVGVAAASLLSAQFQPYYGAPGYYPAYAYPALGYSGYGYPAPLTYSGYGVPSYAYGGTRNAPNVYTRNVYRYYGNAAGFHRAIAAEHNRLVRDRRRIASLRARGDRAGVAQLRHQIGLDRQRIARARATRAHEQRVASARAAHKRRARTVAAHVRTAHMRTSRLAVTRANQRPAAHAPARSPKIAAYASRPARPAPHAAAHVAHRMPTPAVRTYAQPRAAPQPHAQGPGPDRAAGRRPPA